MSIKTTILKITKELISAFAELDKWFDESDNLAENVGRWSRAQILEHVMLTNHFLLILIEKGSKRAIQNSLEINLPEEVKNYTFQPEAMIAISKPGAFKWESPQHMEPNGSRPLPEIREELREQLYRCLVLLDRLSNGEGVAYKMTLSVNNLGKLDMYQYMYFLILHIQRHLNQLQKPAIRCATTC